ncbi:MAG: CotH kinase family protein [Bacteroidales bacterium]|nr:CotH kinase family protein [Bacteroidales bacterium]
MINEFQADNVSTVKNPNSGNYDDWVELYNIGTQEVNIGGYYLTNEKSDTTKWQIPLGIKIQAKGYLLIWLDNSNVGLQSNFKLDKNGDIIILYNSNKERLDIMSFSTMAENTSIGRMTDGNAIWSSFMQTTPSGANNTSATTLSAPEPIFSVKAGYYTEPVNLTLTSFITNAKIYYTLDGSSPTTASALYTKPISISSNTVLKTMVQCTGYKNSRVATRTYFVGERNSTLPVVSIGVDPYNFFDETDGMYMMGPNASMGDPNYGANFWEDIEEPVTFEYFVDGEQEVEVNAGIKIFGGWSRRFAQRSFSINCKQEFGDERMRYQLFNDKPNDVYKQVILRNSGSDVNSLKYRDLMLQNMVSDRMDIDYQAGQPTIVYINGEYWGIMNLREKIQERYLKDNYNLEEEDITVIANYKSETENGGSTAEFESLLDYFNNTDFSNNTNYNSAKNKIDVNEFMNYQITEIYYGNFDWPNLNIKYWKKNGSGNKWRWIVYDLDQSTAYYENCNQYRNSLEDAYMENGNHWANGRPGCTIFRGLLENTEFKNEFVQRFAAHINSTFATERFSNFIDTYDSIYADEKPYHLERWGHNDSLWNAEKSDLHLFAEERPALMQGFIQDMFGISSMSTLTVEAKNAESAKIEICSVAMEGKSVVGEYFTNIPLTVSVKQTTRKFIHWEESDGTVISTDLSITLTLKSDKKIIAVFDQSSGLENVFINELMASNTNTIADNKGDYEDWIELYNANDFAVDISGLYVTDNFDNPTKYQIPQGIGTETIIPAKGFLLLWADDEKSEGATHVEFKLSGSGEQFGLAQVNGGKVTWIDSVLFFKQASDMSFGRSVDGSGTFVSMQNTTPRAPNTLDTNLPTVAGTIEIKLYPTVIDRDFYVESNQEEQLSLEIYSLTGAKIGSTEFVGGGISTINTTSLNEGVYFVKVSNPSINKTFKIIKK